MTHSSRKGEQIREFDQKQGPRSRPNRDKTFFVNVIVAYTCNIPLGVPPGGGPLIVIDASITPFNIFPKSLFFGELDDGGVIAV